MQKPLILAPYGAILYINRYVAMQHLLYTWKDKSAASAGYKRLKAAKNRGIAIPQASITKETEMLKFLSSLFGSKAKLDNDYRLYAKTEYGSDWQFAYDELRRTGTAPFVRGVYK